MRDAGQDQSEEVVDGELVEFTRLPAPGPRQAPPISPDRSSRQVLDHARHPAAQNAMAAATGFVAGAATLALARRYGRARLERALAAVPSEPFLPAGAPLGPGRTYLVHVRQLGAPDT